MRRQPDSTLLAHPHLWLAGVMLIAFVLRFQYLLEIEHNIDHAHSVWQALRTLAYGEFPITGIQSSVLGAHPTLMGYLYIPFIGTTHTLIAVYVFIIALNTTAVYLTYRAVQYMGGAWMGVIAAALVAVNPWMIEYSRTSWHPALMPFWMSLLASLLWPVLLGVARRPARRLLMALVVLTIMSQTVLIAYFVLPSVVLLLLIFWRRVPRRALAVGAVLFLAVSAVYAAGLAARAQDLNAKTDAFRTATTSGAVLKPDALQHALRLVSGRGYDTARAVDPVIPVEDQARRQQLTSIAAPLVEGLLVIGVGLALWSLIRRPISSPPTRRDSAVILLVWFFVPVGAMSYNGSLVHPYYLLVTVPAGAALAAWAVCDLVRLWPRGGRVLVVGAFVPFAMLMALNSARYYQETERIPGAHGLTALPLTWGLRLGQAINAHLPAGGVVFSDVEEWILNSFAAQPFPVVQHLNTPDAVLLPVSGSLTVVASAAPDVPPPGMTTEKALELPDGTWLMVYGSPAGVPALPADVTPYAVRGETWLNLEGYHVERDEDVYHVQTYWRVAAETQEIAAFAFTPSAHLINEAGERVQIIDGVAIPARLWHAGDLLMQQFTVTLPAPGRYHLNIGQYDGVQQRGLIFILGDGTYTDMIPLPDAVLPEEDD